MEIYSQNEFLSKTDEQCLKDIFLKENSVQGVYAKSAHFYNIDM